GHREGDINETLAGHEQQTLARGDGIRGVKVYPHADTGGIFIGGEQVEVPRRSGEGVGGIDDEREDFGAEVPDPNAVAHGGAGGHVVHEVDPLGKLFGGGGSDRPGECALGLTTRLRQSNTRDHRERGRNQSTKYKVQSTRQAGRPVPPRGDKSRIPRSTGYGVRGTEYGVPGTGHHAPKTPTLTSGLGPTTHLSCLSHCWMLISWVADCVRDRWPVPSRNPATYRHHA